MKRKVTTATTTDFLRDIATNPVNAEILARWESLELPDAWLAAGCLFQTIWNLQSGQPAQSGIKDYDLFYYDPADLSARAERHRQAFVSDVLDDLGVEIEVANQARVHLWYPRYFGESYAPLQSAADGIGCFLVKETCVGVRPREYVAPYGIGGVYAQTLTPNPRVPHARLFADKAASYRRRWPHLTVTPDHAPEMKRP